MAAVSWSSTHIDQRWRRYVILVCCLLTPATLVVVASRLGPGISPDSVVYASTARSFAATGSLTDYGADPLTMFPPGLPVLLGAAQRMGIDVQVCAVWLNTACAAISVLLSYLLARRALNDPRWSVGVAVFVGLSVSTVTVHSWLWTEPLFTSLTLLVLLILARAIQRRRVLYWEVLAVAVSVSTATSIRFIGITLLPVVAVGIFMANRSRGRADATVTAVLTTALSSLGLIMVAARNMSLGVPALGVRQPSGISVITVAKQTAVRLGEYVYPTTWPSPLIPALIGIPIAILVVYGFIRSLADRSEIVTLLGLFTGIYWLSLWYSQFATQLDPIDARLTAPVLTPMLILIAYALHTIASELLTRSRSRGPERGGKWVPAVIAGASVLLLGALSMNAAESFLFVRHAATVGNGYNSTESLSSPLASALAKLPRGGIAANDSSLAYWVSGRTPISEIPGRDHYWSAEQTQNGIRDLKNEVEQGEVVYLAFFTSADTSLTPHELQQAGIQIRLLKTYSDGDLYETL